MRLPKQFYDHFIKILLDPLFFFAKLWKLRKKQLKWHVYLLNNNTTNCLRQPLTSSCQPEQGKCVEVKAMLSTTYGVHCHPVRVNHSVQMAPGPNQNLAYFPLNLVYSPVNKNNAIIMLLCKGKCFYDCFKLNEMLNCWSENLSISKHVSLLLCTDVYQLPKIVLPFVISVKNNQHFPLT